MPLIDCIEDEDILRVRNTTDLIFSSIVYAISAILTGISIVAVLCALRPPLEVCA